MQYLYNKDAAGYFTGVSVWPLDPVAGGLAQINPTFARAEAPPAHDLETHRAKDNGGRWVLEALPVLDPEPEHKPAPLEYPRYYGNDKLDKPFTRAEQLAVVTATMTDPVVKLMYDRLLGAAFLSYEDPETEEGLALLTSKGLLTAERKAEIVEQMQPR